MNFKIGDKIFYDGRQGLVEGLNLKGSPSKLKFANSIMLTDSPEIINTEGYKVIGVDDLEHGLYEDAIFLDISYSISALNQGIFDSYKKCIGKKGSYLKTVNGGKFTYEDQGHNHFGAKIVMNADHTENVILLAIPLKQYTMTELYDIVGHEFSIKQEEK